MEGRQAIRRFAPGTLLNQCPLKKQRNTRSLGYKDKETHGLSVAKTENLGAALPGQDRMWPFGIIVVVTRYIATGALGECDYGGTSGVDSLSVWKFYFMYFLRDMYIYPLCTRASKSRYTTFFAKRCDFKK